MFSIYHTMLCYSNPQDSPLGKVNSALDKLWENIVLVKQEPNVVVHNNRCKWLEVLLLNLEAEFPF